eukprot:m.272772 g.272772  ORF g.272772 m.272772 type:complete len:69 (+) comp16111_c0_seq4:2143-2349(+)
MAASCGPAAHNNQSNYGNQRGRQPPFRSASKIGPFLSRSCFILNSPMDFSTSIGGCGSPILPICSGSS